MRLTETGMNFRMLGMAVMRLGIGNPGSQGKQDVVKVQQESRRPRWGQEGKSVL